MISLHGRDISMHAASCATCYGVRPAPPFLRRPLVYAGETSNFPRRNARCTRTFISYTRCDKLQRPLTTAPDSLVMMRGQISAQVARVVANFLTVVSAPRTRAAARVCARRWLAWLCRDSSLQFVRRSKATLGVREHYRR